MSDGTYGSRSYLLQVSYGALILHVAGVERASRLKQNDVRFLQRVWHVLRAVRHNDELPRTNRVVMLAALASRHFMCSSPLVTINISSSAS